MIIRKAKVGDVDEIWRLGSGAPEFQVSDKVVAFWPKEILIDCIRSSFNPIFVAQDNEKIQGFIILNLNSSLKKAIIENIFVVPERRRNGFIQGINCVWLDFITSDEFKK